MSLLIDPITPATATKPRSKTRVDKNSKVLKLVSSTGTYDIRDFSQDFRFLNLIELTETLGRHVVRDAQAKPKIWKKLEYLINLCPEVIKDGDKSTASNVSSTNSTATATKVKPNTKTPMEDFDVSEDDVTDYADSASKFYFLVQNILSIYFFQSEESQEVSLALGHFVVISKGAFIEKLLPMLTSLLTILPRCKWSNSARVTPDFFSYNLVSLLRQISQTSPSVKDEIAKSLTESCLAPFEQIMKLHEEKFIHESQNATRIMYGIFKALSEGLVDVTTEQVQSLINIIDNFLLLTSKQGTQKSVHAFRARLLKSITVFVIKIFNEMLSIKGMDEDQVSKFFKIAMRSMTTEYVSRSLASEKVSASGLKLFTHSVDLAVGCALKFPGLKLKEEVMTALLKIISPSNDIQTKNVKDMEKMYVHTINAVERLADDTETVSSSLKALKDYIETLPPKANILKDEAIMSIGRMLKVDFQTHGIVNISQFAYNVATSMYSELDQEKNASRVVLLTKIAKVVNNNAVTELITPTLMGQFTKKRLEGALDITITKELANIAHLTAHKTFREIVELLFSIYSGSEETSTGRLLAECIYIMSNTLTDPEMRMNLLEKSISLFNRLANDLSLEVKKSKNKNLKAIEERLVSLLPVIAVQLKACNINVTKPDYGLQLVFRRMWFYCIVFNFIDPKAGVECTEAVQKIAQHGPILTCMRPKGSDNDKKPVSFTATELELDELGKNSFIDVNDLYNGLINVLPNPPAMIKRFNLPRAAFLLSMYHLETLRVQSGSLETSMLYLEDTGLFDVENAELYQCLKIVIDQVFKKWLEFVHTFDSAHQAKIVEQQTIHLFKQYCNRLEAVRASSVNFISQITKQFNHVYWSVKCLQYLLDLLNEIHLKVSLGVTPEMITMKLPHTNEIVYLPENFSHRKDILTNFIKLTLDWIKPAISVAPKIIQSSLQEYMLRSQQDFDGYLEHFGHTVATYLTSPVEHLKTIGAKLEVGDKRNGLSVLHEEKSLSFVRSIAMRAYHTGEVYGIKDLKNKDAEAELIERFNAIVKDAKQNKGDFDVTSFKHYMQTSTAAICAEKAVCSKLLQLVVWVPVFLFSQQSLQTAVFCWNWIATSRPEFEIPLLEEMYNAWMWTIWQRYGLFSGSAEIPVIELAVNTKLDNEDYTKSHLPHRIWINFLAERYQYIKPYGYEYAEMFTKFVLKALEDRHNLSKEKESMGTRFRLCLLGFYLSRHLEDQGAASLLRERVLAAALSWFELYPTWYDPGTPARASEDMLVLKEFVKRLSMEREQLKRNRSGTIADNMDVKEDGDNNADSSSVVSRKMSVARSFGTIKAIGNDTGKFISLLLILVSHEVDRMKIWKDPINGHIATNDMSEDFEQNQKRSKFEKKDWVSYVRAAWSFSPRLGLQMAVRFPQESIREELRRLVALNVNDLVDITDAVVYLVTPENVSKNAACLKALLDFKPAALTIALTFLNIPFIKNPYVEQYAIRILRSFSADAAVFYLPQLVQCLRHDERGALKRHLIRTCNDSAMFSHQLLWTLRTEIINYEELSAEEKTKLTPAEIQLSEIGRKVYEDILKAFSPAQTELYKEEFDFFDKIITISGVLVPVDKEKRSDQLLVELQSLETTKRLYLPTSKQLRILRMDKQKATTLKSAKKVPILVPFIVKERKGTRIEEVEEDDGDKSKEFKRLLIFKAGDDCRQDQLALQIIAIFKRIFDRAKLNLYLFPYRVITTAYGQGIIECVPDTMSRHQLGSNYVDLVDYFKKRYGHEDSVEYQKARRNFVESMAAYSVVSFILNIKDRHNGNILVDEQGHVIHIDFGFIFDIAPGGNASIELSPFKLTKEMLAIMGEKELQQADAVHAEPFELYQELMLRGYLAARDFSNEIISVVDLMIQSQLPCFKPGCIDRLKARLSFDKSEREAVQFMKSTIAKSYDNLFSKIYDTYQYYFEGVAK